MRWPWRSRRSGSNSRRQRFAKIPDDAEASRWRRYGEDPRLRNFRNSRPPPRSGNTIRSFCPRYERTTPAAVFDAGERARQFLHRRHLLPSRWRTKTTRMFAGRGDPSHQPALQAALRGYAGSTAFDSVTLFYGNDSRPASRHQQDRQSVANTDDMKVLGRPA